jgi:hypothetical protein
MQQHQIQFDSQQGYIVDGIVMNDLSERLEYFQIENYPVLMIGTALFEIDAD